MGIDSAMASELGEEVPSTSIRSFHDVFRSHKEAVSGFLHLKITHRYVPNYLSYSVGNSRCAKLSMPCMSQGRVLTSTFFLSLPGYIVFSFYLSKFLP